MTKERRKHRRAPLAFPLQLQIEDIDKFTEAHALNLSEGGIFLQMPTPLSEGCSVKLQFSLEQAGKSIQAEGKVVRVVDGSSDGPSGCAVVFTELGKEGRRLIELVVQRYGRLHPSQTLKISPDLLQKSNQAGTPEATPGTVPSAVDLVIRLRTAEDEAPADFVGHTLPRGEILVATVSPHEVGTEVQMDLSRGEEGLWVSASGIVTARVYSPGSEKVPPGPGMAVALDSPSQDVAKLLQDSEISAPQSP